MTPRTTSTDSEFMSAPFLSSEPRECIRIRFFPSGCMERTTCAICLIIRIVAVAAVRATAVPRIDVTLFVSQFAPLLSLFHDLRSDRRQSNRKGERTVAVRI